METWRIRLLYLAVIAFVSGYITELYLFPSARGPLYILLISYFLSFTGLLYQKTDIRKLTAKIAIGSLSMVIAGGLVILLITYGNAQTKPWPYHWYYAISALLGAGVVYISWERAQKKEEIAPAESFQLEAAPQKNIAPSFQWDDLDRRWKKHPHRLLHLRSLRRIHLLNEKGIAKEELRKVLQQECTRLEQEANAQEKQQQEGDALSQAARLVEWGIQKLPEIAELNVSDVLMAKTIADIRTLHTSVEKKLVSHHQLLAIHPIDRDTANEKCNARAQSIRTALPLLENNEMKLTENLIDAQQELEAFSSITGFQVVKIPEGYVTFEGNGRREAIKRAFPHKPILVEVREFIFSDDDIRADIIRRVNRVRRWKDVVDLP